MMRGPPRAAPARREKSLMTHDDFSTERWPPAPGFTEAQLNDVPLLTVRPAMIPAVVGAGLMFLALQRMSYDYYELLRWAVPAAAIWIIVIAKSQHRTFWVVVMAAVAVVFNPLVPFTMPRENWGAVNIYSLLFFLGAGYKLRASRPGAPTTTS